MPVPGQPRNPFAQTSNRFHLDPVPVAGRNSSVIARPSAQPGRIRRFLEPQPVYTGATPAFSWTRNALAYGAAAVFGRVSNPRRYLISTSDTLTAGNQLSNPALRPPVVRQRQAPAPPLISAGNVQARPTVRARMRSFGSRVAPLNGPGRDAIS